MGESRDKVQAAIERGKKDFAERVAKANQAVPDAAKVPVATVATKPAEPLKVKTPTKPPRFVGKERSAKARDARLKMRGRLPAGAFLVQSWNGEAWVVRMTIYTNTPGKLYSKSLSGDKVFDLIENLDVAYWEWYAMTPDADPVKASIMAGQTQAAQVAEQLGQKPG